MAPVRSSRNNSQYIPPKDDLIYYCIIILIIIIGFLLGYLLIGKRIFKYLYNNFIFKNNCANSKNQNTDDCKNVFKTEQIIRNITSEGFVIYLLWLSIVVIYIMIYIKIFM